MPTTATRLILVCGLPGAGKTTRSRVLAEQRGYLRLCPDEWLDHLGLDLFDEGIRSRLETEFWTLAQQLLLRGVSVILESGFWLRADRDEKRLGARALAVGVELHYLNVSLENRWDRINARNKTDRTDHAVLTRDVLASFESYFEAPDSDECALFDPIELVVTSQQLMVVT